MNNGNKTFIYESPDGGKTVYRRPFMDHSPVNRVKIIEENKVVEENKKNRPVIELANDTSSNFAWWFSA